MRRIGNIYYKISLYDNLVSAYYKAQKGKSKKSEIIEYSNDLENNLEILRNQIINQQVNIGNYRFFFINDPKPRDICAAAFHERILHHAIMNICEPVLDKYAIYDCYACRKNKGTKKAVYRCKEFVVSNTWYLKMDIKKYFDSIDHKISINLLLKKFKDKKLILLFEKILNTYHKTPFKGVPIGNLISQHLANYYLGIFDHWIKENQKIKCYLRYMDDFVVFGQNKYFLKQILEKIQDFLYKNLKLELKHTTQLNKCYYGVPFLGFRVFKNKIHLNPNSKKRFTEKFILYQNNYINEKRWGK